MVKCRVTYDYDATQPDELTIHKGDIINDVKKTPGGWWEGVLNGKRGVFPDNFVEDYNVQDVQPPAKANKPGGAGIQALQAQIGAGIRVGPPPPKKTAAAPHGKPRQMAVVLFEYKPEQPDELELMEGEEVEIVKMEEEGWWEGVLRGKRGMFPSNFVKLMDTAPPPAAAKPPYQPPHDLPDKPNDIGGSKRIAGAPGGRPPAEKPKMPAPSPVNDAAPPPALPKRSRGVRAKVIYSYHAQNDDELTLEEGQIILVTDQKLEDPGWWKGEMGGRMGVFPDNFVELLNDDEPQPTTQQSQIKNKPPPQPPVEEQPPPGRLPPRPAATEPRQPTPPSIKSSKPYGHQETDAAPVMKPQLSSKMVNGGGAVGMMVDDGAVALLREEIEKIKSSMVTRESYELLQRELKATKDALDSYKKDNNKKLSDFMNEIDEVRKTSSQTQIDVSRVRKLAEDHWTNK